MSAYDGANIATKTGIPSYQNVLTPFASTWGDNLTVYANGIASTAASYDGTMGGGNLYIGGTSQAQTWNGTIRHVKILSTELTAAEVADL